MVAKFSVVWHISCIVIVSTKAFFRCHSFEHIRYYVVKFIYMLNIETKHLGYAYSSQNSLRNAQSNCADHIIVVLLCVYFLTKQYILELTMPFQHG